MDKLMDALLGKIDWLLVWLVPASILGAFFGDAWRKDVLTTRQRAAAGLAMSALGVVGGVSLARQLGLDEYAAAAFAILIAALGTDIVGLLAALIRKFKEDPASLLSLLPWGKK